MPAIILKNLTKKYGNRVILNNLIFMSKKGSLLQSWAPAAAAKALC